MNESSTQAPGFSADDEPLYTDENGIPMLFDVVIPGDYVKAANAFLKKAAPRPAPLRPEELELRIEAAVETAMPLAAEQAARVIREAVLAEVRNAMQPMHAPDSDD